MNQRNSLKKNKVSQKESAQSEKEAIVTLLLKSRGIKGQKAEKYFLEPDFSRDLHDPFLMRGMPEVIKRIKKALKAKERIGIFGDYDADGVCGSSVLYSVFKRIGFDPLVETYLPDRQKQGFGLSISGIAYFLRRGVSLIITVDCGITNHNEILFAAKKGIDVIVTDHHLLSQGEPPSLFLNPKRPDETYPFRELCGTGVAFKLAQALKQNLNNKNLSEAWEKRLLDLVAIATIADMMPLVDENRTLVAYGLKVIRKGTHRQGLKALLREAGLQKESINAKDIAFQISPRINATSRIDHAVKALRLLLAKDPREADVLAKSIERLNKRRRTIVDKIVRQITQRTNAQRSLIEKKKLVFESDRSWQPGILSLVSNKMKDEFMVPAIVVSMGKKFCIASCRAHPPFSLVQAMEKINTQYPSLFVRWGGHHQAAGFTVRTEDLSKAKAAFEEIVASRTFNTSPEKIEAECELAPQAITLELYEAIRKLEPFGKGNPEPIFLLRNARIASIKKMGSREAHYRIALEKDGYTFEAVFFNGVKNHEQKPEDAIDVTFNLALSEWRGITSLELHVLDLCES